MRLFHPAAPAAAAVLALALALLTLLLPATPAHAKKIVYSPVVHEGEKEIEYYVDWREAPGGADTVGHELALEYAFGPRDQIALYGVWQGVSGTGTAFVQHNVEWIHQLFEQGERAWDVGTYVEYQVPADTAGSADKVEFKLLLERTFSRATLTLNPVFEKELGKNAAHATEVGYGARYAWRLRRALEPAIEAYGDMGEVGNPDSPRDQSHLVGPAVDLRLGRHLLWHVGALFGLTGGSEDVRIKSQLAVEWY